MKKLMFVVLVSVFSLGVFAIDNSTLNPFSREAGRGKGAGYTHSMNSTEAVTDGCACGRGGQGQCLCFDGDRFANTNPANGFQEILNQAPGATSQ